MPVRPAFWAVETDQQLDRQGQGACEVMQVGCQRTEPAVLEEENPPRLAQLPRLVPRPRKQFELALRHRLAVAERLLMELDQSESLCVARPLRGIDSSVEFVPV